MNLFQNAVLSKGSSVSSGTCCMSGRSSKWNEEPFTINVWGAESKAWRVARSFCLQTRVWGSMTWAVTLVNVSSCFCVACWEWMLHFWVKIQNVTDVGLVRRWALATVKKKKKKWIEETYYFFLIFRYLFSIIVHSPGRRCEVFCRRHGPVSAGSFSHPLVFSNLQSVQAVSFGSGFCF